MNKTSTYLLASIIAIVAIFASGSNVEAYINNPTSGSGGSGVSDWLKQTNYNVLTLTPTTTIPVWVKDQFFASSSAIIAGMVTADTFNATNTNATSTLSGGLSVGSGTQYYTLFSDPNDSNTFKILGGTNANNSYFNILTSGLVGIGTTTPKDLLSIQGGWLNLGPNYGIKMDSNVFTTASTTGAYQFEGLGAGAGVLSVATDTSITSGAFSTAFGYQALANATSGAYKSTAVGYQALKSSATASGINGIGNTAIGYQALTAITTGNTNTALGRSAGVSITSGTQNVYLGDAAGSNQTTGSFNTCVGTSVCQGGGSTNVGIGIGALQNVTGIQNTVVGPSAGVSITSANNNVFLGYSAGRRTTGSNNLYLGTSVASTSGSGNQNIVIGYDLFPPSINGSNQLNIGNMIFGTGLTSESSTSPSGILGIGSSTLTTNSELNIGTNPTTTNGSTTISTGNLQFQSKNSAGTVTCSFLTPGNVLFTQAGPCIP
jgi:hypothetical protein